jgi:hypothetical protein
MRRANVGPKTRAAQREFRSSRDAGASRAYLQVPLSPGTYSISTNFTSVNRAVFDGDSVVKKGQNWFPISNCTLTVT